MRRDALLLAEIIDAAERIVELTSGASVEDLVDDRSRREALLWSFTVLGEASSQIDEDLKADSPDVPWRAATALRNRIVQRLLADQYGYSLSNGSSLRVRR